MFTILQKIGANINAHSTEFVVWAPLKEKVELVLQEQNYHAMVRDEFGYWKISLPAPPGTRYKFRLDGELVLPDPASFSLPDGVHGASQVVDPQGFSWQDETWQGLPMSNMIIYELHTGCFSSTHDFEGIIHQLDYLADLGINTLELMPLGQFAGDRNWGYDGVGPFAVQDSYGGYEGFQRLVNAAHAKGMAVLVDVVYNHMGPEGNYLPAYGPYFSGKYRTPWGSPLNYDGAWSDGVRNYFLQNARMWLEDYRADGLRIDAVHAIYDLSAHHFMQELKELALDIEQRTGRKKTLIAELDLNDPRYINPVEKGGYGLDGQWIDEFHHALRTLMTGDRKAYYEDFGEIADLQKAFEHTYVYNGIYSNHRKRTFGGHADRNPYSQFVVFSQNHDQVGNRALGDRLTHNLDFEQLKLAAAAVLLSPYIPLLFMGEEYGEKNPFQFFTSFSDPALIEGVRKGRQSEFPEFSGSMELPDPQSENTFLQSNLSWDYQEGANAVLLSYYRHLILLRKTRPAMQGMTRDAVEMRPLQGQVLSFERKILNDHVYVWLNFGQEKIQQENDTGAVLVKIFDSAAAEWGGEVNTTRAEIAPGAFIELQPHSALFFEKQL